MHGKEIFYANQRKEGPGKDDFEQREESLVDEVQRFLGPSPLGDT